MTTREERQAATARMPRCQCGNVPKLGELLCGACQHVIDLREEKSQRVVALVELIEEFTKAVMRYENDADGHYWQQRDFQRALLIEKLEEML